MSNNQNLAEYEYILPMHDDYIGQMIDDPRIKGIEFKSKCIVELSKRVLNRKMAHFGWVKFNIIKVSGPSEVAIHVCNKLLENTYPAYRLRKPYESDAQAAIYIDDLTPDNNFVIDAQRSGANLDTYQGLNLKTAYKASNRYPNVSRRLITPWQVNPTQIRGVHFPEHWSTDKVYKFLYPNNIKYLKPIKHSLLPSDIEKIKEVSNQDYSIMKNKVKSVHPSNNFNRRLNDRSSVKSIEKGAEKPSEVSFYEPERFEQERFEIEKFEPEKYDPKTPDDVSLKVQASIKAAEDMKMSVKVKIETKEITNENTVGGERYAFNKEIIIPEDVENATYEFNEVLKAESPKKVKTDSVRSSKLESHRSLRSQNGKLTEGGSQIRKSETDFRDDSVNVSLLVDDANESKRISNKDPNIVAEDETLKYKTPQRSGNKGKCKSSSRTSRRAFEDSVDVNVSDIYDDNVFH